MVDLRCSSNIDHERGNNLMDDSGCIRGTCSIAENMRFTNDAILHGAQVSMDVKRSRVALVGCM